MDRLKILWFNWRCWLNPSMGGAEVFTCEVAKRWVQAGHEVTLFSSEYPGCPREEVLEGIRVVRRGGKYSVYGQAKKTYRQRFSKENFDVVIDEVNTRPFAACRFVSGGEKVVNLIHQLAREFWYYETPFPVSYVGDHFLEGHWLRQIKDAPTFTVSESTRADLLALGFRQVFVVPEGLNFTPLAKVPEKEAFPVVVYAGRLRRAKRPDHAVKAFGLVRERFPKAELWVIGDGVFEADLKRMAGAGVRFFNGLGNGERRELIRKAWVLVNPSVREGFGLNVVEANALGVPCVAYDVGGLRDAVLNGETGLLVSAGDVEALAGAVERFLGDDTLRERVSEAALAYSRGFSWDCAAETFLGSIRRVCGI